MERTHRRYERGFIDAAREVPAAAGRDARGEQKDGDDERAVHGSAC
jgi:hypothetical protein